MKTHADSAMTRFALHHLHQGASRRHVMKMLLASGAGLAGSTLVLGTATRARAAIPKSGGHLRVGIRAGSTSDSLNPATFTNGFIRTVAYGMCNGLFEIRADNSLGGELIESWEAKPGAAEWVFKVRQGVEFHNGKALSADDIIASINHHRGEDTISGLKGPLSSIAEIRKQDDFTIAVTLQAGNADFPFVFTDYRLVVMPASADGTLDWKAQVGTGGYVLKSLEPGVSAEMERFPGYWRQGQAHVESARILVVPDAGTQQTALLTGELDVIDQVDFKSLNLLKASPTIKVIDTVGARHFTFPMNTQAEPFANNDLRLALKHGIDREAMLKTVLRGYGTLGNDHPVAPSQQFFAADIEQRAYDPDKATFHLKKAGHDAISLSLSVSDSLYPGAVDGAVLYKEKLDPIGIDLEVLREPGDGYFSNVWMKKPFVASFWGARPTADLILSTAYMSGAPWNDSFLDNERLTGLITGARSEIDEAKRAEMYREIQMILRDEGGTVIPIFANNVFAVSDKIGHPEAVAGNWELDGGRLLDRWWFA
ncbi:MAG: ABC transporter substrate-binding protein [Pseudomonadota bacterium]